MKRAFSIKFRGYIWVSKGDLKLAKTHLELANFDEGMMSNPMFVSIYGKHYEAYRDEHIESMRHHYDLAASHLGFRDMKSLLTYQRRWSTDIVHGVNESVLV